MQYYNTHASEYFTFSASPLPTTFYAYFLSLLPTNAAILDIGCGSGRDLKYFSKNRYEAEGLDASEPLCQLAREHSGCPVHFGNMLTWQPNRQYDGLWACASILHLPSEDIPAFFRRVPDAANKEIERNILSNPFKRFEDMQMMRHTRTLGIVEVDSAVWKKLTKAEKDEIRQICHEKLSQYYARFK